MSYPKNIIIEILTDRNFSGSNGETLCLRSDSCVASMDSMMSIEENNFTKHCNCLSNCNVQD